MQEMAKQFGGSFGFPMGEDQITLVLNYNNPIIKKLAEIKEGSLADTDDTTSQATVSDKENGAADGNNITESGDAACDSTLDIICGQIYDIALLAHKQMDTAAVSRFIERSVKILEAAFDK